MNRRHTTPTRQRRGSVTYGMASLILFLGAMCAITLLRAVDMYRHSAQQEQRMQALAAAEGVAMLVARDPEHPPSSTTLGNCVITSGKVEPEADVLRVPLFVVVLGKNEKPVFESRFHALFDGTGGNPVYRRLEKN